MLNSYNYMPNTLLDHNNFKYHIGYYFIWALSQHTIPHVKFFTTLQWRHNERDGVSNHQPHDCLLNRLFGGRSKKISKLHVSFLCEGNSPVTGEFPVQMASNAGNVSISWRHHEYYQWDTSQQSRLHFQGKWNDGISKNTLEKNVVTISVTIFRHVWYWLFFLSNVDK